MGAGSVTIADAPTPVRRWSWRWVLFALAAICVVAAIGTYLTATRPGGRMDPTSTGPDGAHALVALLRDHGVTVVVANFALTLILSLRERRSLPVSIR